MKKLKTKLKRTMVVLLISSLFLGSTIEISEGSIEIGIILFLAIPVILYLTLRGERFSIQYYLESKTYILIGIIIILADIVYNIEVNSKLGTIDIMTFLLGISFIAQSVKEEGIKKLGVFSMYMSAIFLVLFLIFFSLFNYLNINYIHIFDHFVVMLPSVFIVKLLGIPVTVLSIETVKISGSEDVIIVIGGPCSGLYSMFLLIAFLVAYIKVEKKMLSPILLLSTIAIAYFANLVRVSILYIVAYFYGYKMMKFVHVHLGWIIFAIVIVAVSLLLRKLESSSSNVKNHKEE